MHGGQQHTAHRYATKRDKCQCRADETIQRMSGINRAKGRDSARGCQNGRYFARRGGIAQAQFLARDAEASGENQAADNAGSGAKQTDLDGIAHQQQRTQCQRHAANPNGPVRAQHLFQTARSFGG